MQFSIAICGHRSGFAAVVSSSTGLYGDSAKSSVVIYQDCRSSLQCVELLSGGPDFDFAVR